MHDSRSSPDSLGGSVYLSLTVGGPIAGWFIRYYERDASRVIGLAVNGNALTTLFWALTPTGSKYSALIFICLRIIMGLFQSFICVFLPIWVIQHAPCNKKTSWMAYLQASVPVGIMLGYILAAVVLELDTDHDQLLFHVSNWRWPIIIEVCALLPFCLGFFFIPNTALNLILKYDNLEQSKGCIVREEGRQLPVSLCEKNQASESVFSIVYSLFRLPGYKYLIGTMTSLYFVVTGIQFWIPSYMLVVISSSRPLVNANFIAVASTAPTIGILFGGWLIDYHGGFKTLEQRIKTLKICLLFGFLSVCSAVALVFIRVLWQFSITLWILLFCGAAILPSCSGIVLSIVPDQLRPTASSLNLMIFNFFGYFLSLTLSGWMMQLLIDDGSCNYTCSRIWGFRMILSWSIFSLTFLALALMDTTVGRDKFFESKKENDIVVNSMLETGTPHQLGMSE